MSGAMLAMIATAAALGGLAVYFLIPRGLSTGRPAGLGLAAGALLLLWVIWLCNFQETAIPQRLAFCLFASVTVIAALLTVTQRNPVSSALCFALVVIGSACLFVIQNAQFLAAAIVVVYAGAIIVMFLFVIMLAQQAGMARHDRFSREPTLVVVTAFVLLLALVAAVVTDYGGVSPPLAPSPDRPLDPMASLMDGRQEGTQVGPLGIVLFREHWVSVEVAGTMLLVAMVGAVLITARKQAG